MPINNPGDRCVWMFFDLFLVEDMKNGVAGRFQIIREQAAMAAPPHGFSTHHSYAPITREFK